jgi:hypothetical protein
LSFWGPRVEHFICGNGTKLAITSAFSNSLINWSLLQNIEFDYINETLDITLIFSLN